MLNTGIEDNKVTPIAEGLSRILAETYTLYLKTHKYHWNVTGPMFQSLHTMFEEQYTNLATAVDVIAERIRVLGVPAPGSYSEFIELSEVKEDSSQGVNANQMIQNLLSDNEQIARSSKKLISTLEGANDEGTASLLGERIEYHEKTAWMLKSSLG